MTVPWQTSETLILESAGWKLFHQMDDRWFAVHAATGRVAAIDIDTESFNMAGIEEDSFQHFEKHRDYAAYQLLNCLAEFYNHDKWLRKRDEEENS